MTMTIGEWLEREELPRLHQQFERRDYMAFMEGLLLCCLNAHPLPDWIAAIVINQAEDVFAKSATGPGRQGNWRAKDGALQIETRRAMLADFHLRARRQQGRFFTSWLGRIFGYGRPIPGDSVNIVTRADVFKFVSQQLMGKTAKGSPDAIEESYNAWKNKRPKRKRTKRKRTKRKQGGE